MDETTSGNLTDRILTAPSGGTLVVRTSETRTASHLIREHDRLDLGILSIPDSWPHIEGDSRVQALVDEALAAVRTPGGENV